MKTGLCLLLEKYNVSLERFNILAKAEDLNDQELNDLDYIEDRLNVWKEVELI